MFSQHENLNLCATYVNDLSAYLEGNKYTR